MRAAILALLIATAPLAVADDATPEKNRASARKALDWLLVQPGLLDAPTSNGMAVGKGRCALAMTGWLLELFPEHPRFAAARKRIYAQLKPAILRGSMVQGSWPDALFGLYLAERALRGGIEDGERELRLRLLRRIESSQNAEGGWGHGGLSISFYPSTLIASTNLSILALGLARRDKLAVQKQVIDKARRLYRGLQSEAGAWPYGGLKYRKGYEAGRTSATLAALLALGNDDDDLVARAERYLLANPARVPHGHASPAMHIFSGALAFAIMGKASVYQGAVLDRVIAKQQADGTFDDLLPNSPDSMKLGNMTGGGGGLQDRAYLGSFYACALVAGSAKTTALLTRVRRAPAAQPESVAAPELKPAWTVESAGAFHLLPRGGKLLLIDGQGRARAIDAASGKAAELSLSGLVGKGLILQQAWLVGDLLLTLVGPPRDNSQPLTLSNDNRVASKAPTMTLSAFPLDGGARRWKTPIRTFVSGLRRSGEVVLLGSMTGPPLRIRLRDGVALGALTGPGGVVNRALAIHPDGRMALSGESELRLLSAKGDVLWQRKAPRRYGITPAAKGALAWLGDRLVEGTTAGTLRCRDGASGKSRWRHELPSAIAHLRVVGDRVLAQGGDGSLDCYSAEGELQWRYRPPAATESGRRPELQANGNVVATIAPSGKLELFALADGRRLGSIPLKAAGRWSLGARRIHTLGDAKVRAYELPARD